LAAGSSPLTLALPDLRLSVIYQPEPLKTMPTGWKTRRNAPVHDEHIRSGSSLKDWNCSN
jgi:hypothetical protein